MKTNLILATALICFTNILIAQTASDALEDGIRIKSRKKLFLKYVESDEKQELEYDLAKSLSDPSAPEDFKPFPKKVLFLSDEESVNVYMRPLNPLNYSYGSVQKTSIDSIDQRYAVALGAIIDNLGVLPVASAPSLTLEPTHSSDCSAIKNSIIEKINNIKEKLEKDQKDDIKKIFQDLKALNFIDQNETNTGIEKSKVAIKEIQKHFTTVDSIVKDVKDSVEDFIKSCSLVAFEAGFVFNQVVQNLTEISADQQKRLTNLNKVFKLVEDEQKVANSGGGTGLTWLIPLKRITTPKAEISTYTVKILKSKYQLSNEDEIVAVPAKELLIKAIKVRRFQKFIPEISVGAVYTFFTYNAYGTTNDMDGNIVIADPVETDVRNLNVATAINYNLYLKNSRIHPFYQLGIGINSGMPTLFTGLGIRINASGLRRLALSGGIAATWIKELDKLKVGDVVSGTNDITEDLKFQFSWPPQPYIGVQFNF